MGVGRAMRKRFFVTMMFFLSIAWTIPPVFASLSKGSVGYIDSVGLGQIFDLAYLVDCRSRFEYDVLHMKNAVHIPVGTMVRDDLDRLRAKNPGRPIVFYCNGDD